MKTKIILIASLINFNSFAQLEDGIHYYTNDDLRVDLNITEGGLTIESVIILDRNTGEKQEGTGVWHKINLQGADDGYDGPEGFYEFQTNECNYEFDAPFEITDKIILSQFDCLNGKASLKYTLTHMYEAEMAEEEAFNYSYAENSDFDEDETEEYFTVFLSKEGNELAEVFLEHQPHLSDCKYFFRENFYREAYNVINQGFLDIGEQIETQHERFSGLNYCRASKFNTSEIINGNCNVCPGNVKYIIDKINPDIVCYSIEFLESKDSEAGSRYALFTKINGRWVYFPIN